MLRIVEATVDRGWDGVDFDDECNMNTERVIEAMKRLKEARKRPARFYCRLFLQSSQYGKW